MEFSEFSDFKDQLIINISKENKNCLDLIDKNKKYVEEYFSDNYLNIVKGFVDDLYLLILNEKKFKIIEKLLRHPLMKVVLREFEKSTVLIRVCEDGDNKKAIEWLLTMNIDINLQDDEGRTALMNAVQHWDLESIIDTFLRKKVQDLADKEGNTALFYACNNTPILKKLVKSNLFDCNHINNDHENALFYCVKRNKLNAISYLIEKTHIDCNLVNNNGKTVAMLLAENTRFNELKSMIESRDDIDINYKNKFDETIVSAFIKSYYSHIEQLMSKDLNSEFNYLKTKNYGNTFKTLIELGCDFNCMVDGDGNTPALFYLMIKDYVSLYYLLENCKNLDLSIKNKYGINASYLSLFIKENDFDELCYNRDEINQHSIKSKFINHQSFDYNYVDKNNNNILTYLLTDNNINTQEALNKMSPKILFSVNNKKENSIIIATKLGKSRVLKKLLEHPECTIEDVNAQDELGNTALHYAVQLEDEYTIVLLKNHQADPSIKNNEGKEAMEASENIDDPSIMIVHTNSIPTSVMEDISEKQKLLSVLKQKTDQNITYDIKNYRVDVFQQNYHSLISDEYLSYYKPPPSKSIIQQWVGEVLYPNNFGIITPVQVLAF